MIRAERVLLVTAIVLVATLFGDRQLIQVGQSQGRSASTETNPFNGLRQRALTVDAKMIGISPGKGQIWGAIVDLGMDTGTATIVCFADGTTSLYLSTGGGIIGGGQHEAVRKVTRTFLAAASAQAAGFATASEYPLPAVGHVKFYLRRGADVLAADATEKELVSGKHALSPLFAAVQGRLNPAATHQSALTPKRVVNPAAFWTGRRKGAVRDFRFDSRHPRTIGSADAIQFTRKVADIATETPVAKRAESVRDQTSATLPESPPVPDLATVSSPAYPQAVTGISSPPV
jgi:hypothetical protein